MKKIKVLDLYAGCGGLSLGFKNSGYNIETAVEIDKWASETLQKNFPKSEVFTCSANEFLKKNLKSMM